MHECLPFLFIFSLSDRGIRRCIWRCVQASTRWWSCCWSAAPKSTRVPSATSPPCMAFDSFSSFASSFAPLFLFLFTFYLPSFVSRILFWLVRNFMYIRFYYKELCDVFISSSFCEISSHGVFSLSLFFLLRY